MTVPARQNNPHFRALKTFIEALGMDVNTVSGIAVDPDTIEVAFTTRSDIRKVQFNLRYDEDDVFPYGPAIKVGIPYSIPKGGSPLWDFVPGDTYPAGRE